MANALSAIGIREPPREGGKGIHQTVKAARVAGAIYLLEVVAGPLSLIYIPSVLFVSGNATATVSNIATHEFLLRLGVVGDLLEALIGLFLTLALYRLFKAVDQSIAALLVILGGLMVNPNLLRQRHELAWRTLARSWPQLLVRIRKTSA